MGEQAIFMDYGASCPVDPRVEEAVSKATKEYIGNPSSLHSFGRMAKNALESSREKVAQLVGANPEEIIFTSGGTESNNIAIKGVAQRYKSKGDHALTSEIEHMSVLNPFKALMKEGFKVTHIPVDKYGMVDADGIADLITEETIMISVHYANGEIGTIQPIRKIGALAREKGIIFHVDGVVAVGKIPVNVVEDNIDILSFSSSDIYGPRGVGALYIRKGIKLDSILDGGGQERGLRSGTENLTGIIGFGEAAQIASEDMHSEGERLAKMRDRLIQGIQKAIPKSHLNGHPKERLPNNVNVRFSYVEGESIILNLDMVGIAASTGSACSSKTLEPSHVLIATGLAHEEAHGSLQLTLGRWSKDSEVDFVLKELPPIIQRLRDMSPLTPKS
jgi:cysteine desulfurase